LAAVRVQDDGSALVDAGRGVDIVGVVGRGGGASVQHRVAVDGGDLVPHHVRAHVVIGGAAVHREAVIIFGIAGGAAHRVAAPGGAVGEVSRVARHRSRGEMPVALGVRRVD